MKDTDTGVAGGSVAADVKWCNGCKTTKPLSEFHKKTYLCKPCRRKKEVERNKNRTAANMRRGFDVCVHGVNVSAWPCGQCSRWIGEDGE